VLDLILFAVLPYLAVGLFLGVSIQRYRKEPYTYTSLSSQFLESKRLFWGSVPFHLAVILLFFGHLIGLLFPRYVTIWNGHPVRLLILESTAMAAGFLAFAGLCGLMFRRATSARLRVNTSVGDILVYIALLLSIVSGLWVALSLRWGSSWYVHTAVPYLWSLAKLQPDVARVAQLPFVAKLHIVSAWGLIGLFSFTRLVHVLVAPVPYLWRPYQLVIWNRARRRRES
jgi:nitrate reductase gamma subunit